MKRRTFLQGLAGASGAVLLGGCSSGGGAGAGGRPTVRVLSWTSLGYPSPFAYTAGPGYWRMSLLFDTLVWKDATGQFLPWLASAFVLADDGLSYDVELRPDLRWADGRPVTARDVAFTFEYYATQTFTPFLIGVPRNVAGVEETGERRLRLRMEEPDATFLQSVLGTVPIVPEHIWSQISNPMAEMSPQALIGTGPYRLNSRDESGDAESYVARDDYFLGAPYVRRIEMVPADNPLTALAVGELDAAGASEAGERDEVLEPFRSNDQFGVVSSDAGFGFPLFFNLRRGGALADLRFRRACIHALNRTDMVTRLLTGNGQVGSAGFLPPTHEFYNPDVAQYPYDPAEAERLLDEGGYRRSGPGGARTNPDGTPLRLTLNLPDVIPTALAELTAANLRDVGIGIDLEVIDVIRLFGLKLNDNFDLAITTFPGPSGIGPNGDPEILRGVYHSLPAGQDPTPVTGNQLHKAAGYANAEVDRLLAEQRAAYDIEERKRLVGEIQQIVAEEVPTIMLYTTTLFFAYRKRAFDQWYYTPGGFGPGLPDVYNKHPYITGRQTGLAIRDVQDS
ncbi:MAG TPA: ABC transporter substrate-binding protein [Acidimicrobiales bacterium]|jgi:peptide/nickel transport system substrate-binding protein|nr:ABC transporter substrate-binding protein [Acidimicrobiales bacterium]